MLVGLLAPGLIAGDRPFQTSLCDDLKQAPGVCAPLERTLSAALRAGGGDLVQLDKVNGADAFSTAVASIADDDRQLPSRISPRSWAFGAEDQLATVPPVSIAE
jgi:hypothetical protein